MKHTSTLTITSLLSILFTTFHLTHDIVRGMSPGGLSKSATPNTALHRTPAAAPPSPVSFQALGV
jgi:hypothetical protein